MTHAPLLLAIPLAVLLLALAIPAAITGVGGRRGSLNRLGRLGLHTPAAQASDRAFELANRVAAPLEIAAGAVGIVCAALVLGLPMGSVTVIVVAVVALAGMLVFLATASRLGEHSARQVPIPARKMEGGGCCGGCGCAEGTCASGAATGMTAGASSTAVIPDLVADAPLR